MTAAEVGYVETHGTGTVVGDRAEALALGRVMEAGRGPGERCPIGSVKGNVGHLEAAAGIYRTVAALKNLGAEGILVTRIERLMP